MFDVRSDKGDLRGDVNGIFQQGHVRRSYSRLCRLGLTFVPKSTKTGITVFLPVEHVLILIGEKILIDIIGFVIDIINFINRGAGKCRAFLRFYHSHSYWFGRFELDSRNGYRPFCVFVLDCWRYSVFIVVLCVSHHESSFGECFD